MEAGSSPGQQGPLLMEDKREGSGLGLGGPVGEQVVNLGRHLFLSSAVLFPFGPLVSFCLHGGEMGQQNGERGKRRERWLEGDR